MSLLAQIEKEIADGNVRAFKHNSLPLVGYNYTETCQFSKAWNEVNLRCRGLVLDTEGNIVARPMEKFFNYEEHPELGQIDRKDVLTVTTKEDGSLIIVFWYDGNWRFCTRGSFNSTQAQLAEKIFFENSRLSNLDKSFTWCFELVGPSNVNVTRHYSVDELRLLAAIETATGKEKDYLQLQQVANECLIRRPAFYDWDENLLFAIKNLSNPNFEGVVVHLRNGLRFKVKSELYCQLHRVLTGEWTTKRTMDMWMTKMEGNFQLDPTIPDEFYTEIRQRLSEIDREWAEFLAQEKAIFHFGRGLFEGLSTSLTPHETRKYMAVNHPELHPYLNVILSEEKEAVVHSIALDRFYNKKMSKVLRKRNPDEID